MNQTINEVCARRSVRGYTNEAVEKEIIDVVVQTGDSAAHGLAKHPRKFTVITKPETLAKVNAGIRDAFRNVPVTEQTPAVIRQMIQKAQDDAADYLYAAPVFIIVSTDASDANGESDTALALGNMMIAAQSLGLGSCWMNQIPRLVKAPPVAALLRELGIPESDTVYGTLVLGHPLQGAAQGTRTINPDVSYFE